jgi:hypothetical protein
MFSCAGNTGIIGNALAFFPKMAIFLRRKIMDIRKSITEADLRNILLEGQLQFPPFEVRTETVEATLDAAEIVRQVDAILKLRWRDRAYRFALELRRLWTPKVISEAIDTVRRHIALGAEGILGEEPRGPLYPLVLVPYLSEEWLRHLEAEGVSGIDLCGNGVIVVPNELLVLRTGFPNRFPWEGTIKNVYRKNSSIVARVFLLVPKFNSVNAVLEQLRDRGGEVTLATVSKVCKSLEDDLIIERFRPMPKPGTPVSRLVAAPALRLRQPEKLLDLLAENYALPAVRRTVQGKCALQPQELQMRLQECMERSGARVVITGTSSTEAYAVMAREPVQSFYCSDLNEVIESLGADLRETDRFANIRLLETRDDFVYFDGRPGLWASPIQCYLELCAGDKRERETADQVRRLILGSLTPNLPKG